MELQRLTAFERLRSPRPVAAGSAQPVISSPIEFSKEDSSESSHTKSADLTDVVLRRRANRAFSKTPVDADMIHRVAARSWTLAFDDARPKSTLLIAIFNATGISPGIHLWNGYALERLAGFSEDLPADLYVPEPSATNIPMLAFVCSDLAAAWSRSQEWGYRDALVRAGQLAYRIWLEGLAEGLAGCLFAGSRQRALELAWPTISTHHLISVGLGHGASK